MSAVLRAIQVGRDELRDQLCRAKVEYEDATRNADWWQEQRDALAVRITGLRDALDALEKAESGLVITDA